MTIELTTWQERWRLGLDGVALVDPVRSGDLLVIADAKRVRAVSAADGTASWTVDLPDEIGAMAAVDDGVVVAVAESAGHRVLQIDRAGKIGWELAGRWNVNAPLASSGDRVLLSAAPRQNPGEFAIHEMSVADGIVIRSLPGWARGAPIGIAGGWAWVEVGQGAPGLRVLDDAGDRILGTGELYALASGGGMIFAEGDGLLRAFDPAGGLRWDRPGGMAQALAADDDGVVCARNDGGETWVVHYDLAGNQRWQVGPFPATAPSLRFHEDTVVASSVRWGNQHGTVVVDRADGRVLTRESGGWSGAAGGVVVDAAAVYAISPAPAVARRERRHWPRAEDAWDPAYLIAVAAQFEWWLPALGGPAARRLNEILAAIGKGGKTSPIVEQVVVPGGFDPAELRDVVAAIRSVGRDTIDRVKDGIWWLACAADWPLDRTTRIEDLPHRRVELLRLDDRRDDPVWEEREWIAGYPQLRSLALRLMGLEGPLGIELAALPCLEYLDLGENVLTRVPPEVRECKKLVHLNLRKNDITSIELDELPKSLLRLDVGQNRLPKASAERLRTALPQAYVEIY
jgi:outer membrane protein assembly factor BamB